MSLCFVGKLAACTRDFSYVKVYICQLVYRCVFYKLCIKEKHYEIESII